MFSLKVDSRCFFSTLKELTSIFSVSWTIIAWFARYSASLISMFRFSIVLWAAVSLFSRSRAYFCFCSHSNWSAFIFSDWKLIVASLSILLLLKSSSSSFWRSTFSLWMPLIVSRLRMSCKARSYLACRSLCRLWRPFSFDSNYNRSCTSSSWVFWVSTISCSSFIRRVYSSSSCFRRVLFCIE